MERKKPGSGAGCYTMLYALQGEQQLLERPVGTKLPLIPGSKPQFCRTALSEKLHQPSPDFTLTDPHGFLLDSKYNSLHDPHLRTYYHRKGMQESLQNRGLINEQKKVLCSLKEYNQYHNYLSNVKLQYDKNYVTKQKTIVKKFLELQEQNEIPRDISFTDVREWLLEEGSKNISDQFMANRDRHQAGAPKTEEICSGEIQRMKGLQYSRQAEMWKIRERALQMRIEEDARREVRQAQLKNQTRARRHKKAFEYYKRKVALQQQKLNESLQERKDFEREMQDRIKRQYFNEILQSGKQASTEIISTENRDVTIANEKSSKITKEVTTDSKWFHEVPLISQLSDGERKVIEKSLYGQITTEELNEMAENIVVWVAASIIRVLLPAISLYSEERSRSVSHCSFESPVYFSSSEEATLSSHSLLGTESGSTWQSQSRSSSFWSTRCRISTPFPSPLSSSGSSGEETGKNTPCLKSRTPSKEIVVADGGEDAGKPLSEPLKDLFEITKSSIITKAERIVQDVLSRALIEAQLPAQLMEPQCCALGVLITRCRSNNLATELVDGVLGLVISALSENKQRIPTPKTVRVNLEAQTESVASEVASEIIQVVSGRLQPFFTSAVESGSTCRLLGGHGGDLHAIGLSQRLHSEQYDEAELAVTATEIISTVLQEVKSEFCKANTENKMSDVKETYSGDNQSMSDFVSAILKNLETISPSSSLSVEKNYLLQSPDALQNERDEAKVTKKRTNGSSPPSFKLKSHSSESSVGMKRANSDIAFGISKAKIIEIAEQIVSQIIEKTKWDFTPVGNNLHESNSKESLLLPEAAEISILENISPKSQIPNNRVTVIAKDIVHSVFENVLFALNCIETNKYLQESNKNVAAAPQTSRGSTERGSIDHTFDFSSVAKGIVRTIFGKLKSLLTQTKEDVSSSSSPAQINAKSSSVSSSSKTSVFSDSVSDISDLCTYTVETAGAICEAMKKELDQEIYCITVAKKASDESLLAREVVTSVLEYLEEQYILDTIKSPSPYPKDWERDASTFIREESIQDQSKSQISPVEEIILSDIDKATGQVPNQIPMEICRYPPKVVSSENISSKQQIGQMDMNLVEDNLSVSSSGESIISDGEGEGSEKMPRTSSSVFHRTATRIISEIIEKAAAKFISSGLAHLPEQPNSTADDVCKTPDATKHAQEAMSSDSSSHVQTTELASDIVVDVLEKLHYATCFEKISFSTDYKDKLESSDTALLPGTSEIKTDTRRAEHLRTMTEELFKTVKNKLKHFWNQKSLSLFKARKVSSAKEQRSADSLEMFPPSVQVSHLSFSEPHLTKKSMSVTNSAPRKHLSEDSEPLGVLMNVDFSRQSRTTQENQANLIICAKDVGSQILQTIRSEINRGDDKGCCSGARAKPSEETLQANELVDSVLSTFENLKVSDVVLKPDYETMHLSGEQYGKDRMSSAEDTVHKEYTKSNRREYSVQRFPPINVPGMVIDSYTDDTEVMTRDTPYRALTDASSKLQDQPTPTAEQENELTCKSNRVPRSRVWKKPFTANDMGLGEQEFMELPCRSNVIEDSFTAQNSLNAAEQKRGSEKTTVDNVEEGDQPSPLISPKLDFSAEHIARAECAVSDIEIVAMGIVDIIMGKLDVTVASDTKSKSRASQKKSECAAGLVTENIAFQTHSNNVNLNIEKLSAEEASWASQVPGATAKHNLPPLQTRVSDEPKDQVRTSTQSPTMSPIERKVEQLVSSGSLRVFSEELVKNVFHLILKSGIAVQLGTAHKSNSDPILKSPLVVQDLSHPKSPELSMQLLYSFTEKSVKRLLKQCLSFPDSPTFDTNEKDVSLFQDCDTNTELKSSQRISEKVSLTVKDHRPQKSTEPSVPSSQMYHDAINQLSSLLVKSVMDVLSAACDLSMEPEESENQGNIPAARVTSEIEKSSSEELKRDSHLENNSEIKPLSVPVEMLNIEPVSSVGLQEISMAKSTESLNMTLVCTETVENIIAQLLLQIYPTLIKEETSTEIPGKMSVSLLSQIAVDLFDSVLQDLSKNQEITVVKQDNDVFHEPHKIQQVASSVHNELLCQTGSQQVLQKAVATRNETVVKTIISSMVTNISKLTHSASQCSSLSPETSISREASEIIDKVMGDIKITSEHNKKATPSAQSSEISLVSSEIVHGVTDNLLKKIQCSNKKKDCLASETPEKPGDYLVQRVQGLEGVQQCKASGKTVKKTKKSSSSPDCMKTQPLESSSHDVKVDELMSDIRIASEHNKEATPSAQSSEVSLVSSEIVHGVTDNLLKKIQLNCSSPESSTPQAAIDMETRSTGQLMCTKMDQLEPSPVIGRKVRSKKLQSPMTKSPKGFSPTVPSGFENSFQPEDTMDKPCSSRSLGEAVGVTPCSNKKKDCLASETPEKPGDYLVQRVQGLEGVQHCKASGKTFKKTKKSSSSPDCMKTQPLESSTHDVKVDELMSYIRIGSEHNKEATPRAQSSEVFLVSSEIVHGVTDSLLKKIQLNCSSPESSTPQAAIDMESRSTEQLMCTKMDQLEPSPVIGRTVRSKKLQSPMTKSPKGFSPTVPSGFENSFQPEYTMDKPCSSRSLGEAVGVTPCSNKKKDCLASETPEKPGDYLVQRVQGLEGVQHCNASGKTFKKTKKSSSSPDCMKTQPLESSTHDVKVDELMSYIRIGSEHNKEATPRAQSSEVSLVSSEIVHGVTDSLLKKIQLNCSSPESSTPQAAIDMESRSTEQLMCTKMDQLEPSPVIGRTVRSKKLQSSMKKSPKGFSPTVPSGFDNSFEPEDTMDKPCSSRSLGEAVGVTPCSNKRKDCLASETPEKPGDYLVQRVQGLEGVQHCNASGKTFKKTKKSSSSPDCMKTQPLESSTHDVKVDELMSYIRIGSEHNKEATPRAQSSEVSLVSSEIVHGVTDSLLKKIQLNCSSPESSTPQAAIDMESRSTEQLMCTKMDQLEPSPVIGRTVRSKKLQSSMKKSPKGFSPTVPSGFDNSFEPEDTMDKPCSSRSLGEAVGVTPCSNKRKDCLASETPEKPGDYLVQRVQGLEGVQHCKASGKTVKKTKKSSSSPDCMKTQPLESSSHDVKVDELMSDIRIGSEHNKEATPRAQSSEVSLVSSEIVHGVTDNLLKKIQLNCSSPESSAEDLKRPLQTLSEMVISITESVIMQLSAVPGITIGTADHDRCIFIQPLDADQMIEKVYNDLLQESGSLIALYDAIMSKNQEVSNAIIVSLVKELSKLYFSTAESSALGPSPSFITNEATNDVNSSENDTFNLGCQEKGMSPPEPPSDIQPLSDIPLPYSDIVKKIVTKLLLRIHPISPKREKKQEQIMDSLSCWELSEFAVGIIDNVLKKLFTAPDTSECNPTMGSNIQCELVSVKQVASCIYRELLQSSGSKDNLQQAVAAKSEALAQKIVDSLVREIMKFQHSDIESSDAPQAAIDMETLSTEQLMCTKMDQLEPSPVMCQTDAVKNIMAKLLLKIRPGFPNPENYSGELEELSESQVRDLALKLTKDALKELTKVSTLTISEPKAEEHLPLQQAIKKTVSSVYSKLMESIGSKKVLQVGIASQNPEMIKEMACCVAKETIANYGLRSGCSIPSSQSLISEKTSKSTQDKIVDTNVTTVRSKKLQSSMKKSPKGFSPTVPSGFENSFQPEDTMDKPCSSRSLGEAVGVTPCSNKKKDCLASETPEKPGDYLVQRVQDQEGVQQCKASGKTFKKTKKSSSRPDCMKTRLLESSSHDVVDEELPGHSSWYVYTPSLNKDKNLSPAQSKSGLRIDIAKHYMTPVQLTKTSEREGLLSHSNIPFAVNTPDEDVNVSQKVKKHPLKKFGSMIKHKIMGNRSKDVRIQNETNPSLENLRAQGTSSGRGSCESFGPFKVPDEYTEPQKHKFFKKEVFSLDRFSRNKPQNTPDGIPVIPNSRKMPKKPSLLSKMSTALSRAFL